MPDPQFLICWTHEGRILARPGQGATLGCFLVPHSESIPRYGYLSLVPIPYVAPMGLEKYQTRPKLKKEVRHSGRAPESLGDLDPVGCAAPSPSPVSRWGSGRVGGLHGGMAQSRLYSYFFFSVALHPLVPNGIVSVHTCIRELQEKDDGNHREESNTSHCDF